MAVSALCALEYRSLRSYILRYLCSKALVYAGVFWDLFWPKHFISGFRILCLLLALKTRELDIMSFCFLWSLKIRNFDRAVSVLCPPKAKILRSNELRFLATIAWYCDIRFWTPKQFLIPSSISQSWVSFSVLSKYKHELVMPVLSAELLQNFTSAKVMFSQSSAQNHLISKAWIVCFKTLVLTFSDFSALSKCQAQTAHGCLCSSRRSEFQQNLAMLWRLVRQDYSKNIESLLRWLNFSCFWNTSRLLLPSQNLNRGIIGCLCLPCLLKKHQRTFWCVVRFSWSKPLKNQIPNL